MKLKHLLSLLLAFTLALALSACAPPSTPTEVDTRAKYTNKGLTLSIPNEYLDLLVIATPDESGLYSEMFCVYERASLEAAEAMFGAGVGGGWLFSIGRVTKAEFQEMMLGGMTGAEAFATDAEGYYYIYYLPTDVQLLRLEEYTDADWKQWTELCEWASAMADTFRDDNPGLTPYFRTYKDIDCALHWVACTSKKATLRAKDSAKAYTPTFFESLPYAEQLLDVLYFDYLSGDLNPEGNYITLSVPDALPYATFDFFTDEGQQQFIRQNSPDSDPIFFVASLDGNEFPAGAIVAQWLDAVS